MLKVVSFKQINQTVKKRTPFYKRRTFVTINRHYTDFGDIEIYTVNHYSKKDKAKKLFFSNFPEHIHTENEAVPKDYLIKLCCEKICCRLKSAKAKTVFVNCEADYETLEKLCRYSRGLFLKPDIHDRFCEKLWKDCGTLPLPYSPLINYDCILEDGCFEEAVLPDSLKTVCPKDFPKTLFCALLYKENGYFVG